MTAGLQDDGAGGVQLVVQMTAAAAKAGAYHALRYQLTPIYD